MAALRFGARFVSRDPSTALTVITIGIDGQANFHGDTGDAMHLAEERRRAHNAINAAERELRRLRVRGKVKIVSPHRREPIPEAISREADRMKADLIVVGSEGRDTLREWIVGGVALRLIYVARRPVAVVRPPRRGRKAQPA
jgi:nucleotide-binding universal stress UspA family protein